MSIEQILEVEDSMYQAGCFVSGIDGRPTHPDSYMTVLDYGKLESWRCSNAFATERLEECFEFWRDNRNVGPPVRLAGLYMERKMKEAKDGGL